MTAGNYLSGKVCITNAAPVASLSPPYRFRRFVVPERTPASGKPAEAEPAEIEPAEPVNNVEQIRRLEADAEKLDSEASESSFSASASSLLICSTLLTGSAGSISAGSASAGFPLAGVRSGTTNLLNR